MLAGFGAVTTLAGFGAMALLGKVIETDPLAVALASITGLALGVGFSLMIVDRFRRGAGCAAAPRRVAATRQGRTVLLSGTALIVALILATAIAPTPILTSIGIGVLLCSALATGAAVVVMPAVLTLLGPRIDAFSFPAPRFLARGLGLARRPRPLGHPLGGRRRRGRHRRAARARAPGRGPRDRAAGRQHAARLDAGAPGLRARRRGHGPGLADAVQRRGRLDEAADHGARAAARRSRPTSAGSRATSASTPSSGPARSSPRAATSRRCPRGSRSSAKLLKGGKKDLGRLEKGLGQAGDGAGQLRAGLASAADGAGKLQAGSGTAGSGAGKLRAGLGQARAGAAEDLRRPARRAGRRERPEEGLGRRRSPGSREARGRARPGRQAGPRGAAGVQAARRPTSTPRATTVTAASGARRSPPPARSTPRSPRCSSMTAGKSDPRYAQTLERADRGARGAGGVQSALAGVQPKLAGAAGVSAAAAKQVGELSVGLSQLYAGSTELQGGIAKLRKGNADLAGGIAQALNTGGGQLTTGLGALNDGAAALEAGLGQLTNGAGELQSGLAGGQGPTGQLVGGLGKLEAGVAKFRGALPSTKDLEQLQRESPGLFDSGYFVLAAIQGAPPADRDLASFAVNLDRGGNAGQIVVVPRARRAAPMTTRELGEDLQDLVGGVREVHAAPRSPSAAPPAT